MIMAGYSRSCRVGMLPGVPALVGIRLYRSVAVTKLFLTNFCGMHCPMSRCKTQLLHVLHEERKREGQWDWLCPGRSNACTQYAAGMRASQLAPLCSHASRCLEETRRTSILESEQLGESSTCFSCTTAQLLAVVEQPAGSKQYHLLAMTGMASTQESWQSYLITLCNTLSHSVK